MDYDLPIVNRAISEYFVHGKPPEETIGACDSLRDFQKVVKVSSKYECALYSPVITMEKIRDAKGRSKSVKRFSGGEVQTDKTFRVFASKDHSKGGLFKVSGKVVNGRKKNPEKFGNTPEHCFIINDDVSSLPVPAELDTPIDGAAILKRLEQCGRVCYKSEAKITDTSAPAFVAGIIKRGHEAVLEHCSFTVKFICDRGVSHEIVRHRLAAYCQESTRYCNYSKEGFGSEITVIKPCFWNENTLNGKVKMDCWKIAMRDAEDAYFALLDEGCTPQEARSVLPNSLKTEVVMTADIREWRHFLKLRCSPAAHPQMREVALILLDKVHSMIPVCFDDIWSEYHEQG